MRKSDKKRDNQIRLALTDVCESALKSIQGFEWLTHSVNYDRFPDSLRVTCIFDTNASLEAFKGSAASQQLEQKIQDELKAIGIRIRMIQQQVAYDTEEDCERFHDGNWARRLQDG